MATIPSVNSFNRRHKDDELATNLADRVAMILAEVGDRLEVRRKSPGQPHQLDVASRFALQTSARLDAVQIAIDVELSNVIWLRSCPSTSVMAASSDSLEDDGDALPDADAHRAQRIAALDAV